MSLLGIASNALNNASVGASTASKNIQNVNTDSYSREVATFTTGPGNYVFVDVKRMTDNFTNARYHTANSQLKNDGMVHDQLSQMNSLITSIAHDSSGEYSNALNAAANSIYQSTIRLSTSDSLPNREQLLSAMITFQDVVSNIEYGINEQKKGMNDLVKQNVISVNNSLSSLHDINEQIRQSADMKDNSLFNKRDQILDDLSEKMGIKATVGDRGLVTLTTQNGVSLLDNNGPREIEYQHDANLDSFRLNIGKHESTAEEIGGELGGLLVSHDEANHVKSEIGGMYFAMMTELNKANAMGFQENGSVGGDIITLASPQVKASSDNSGAGGVTIDSLDHLASQPVRFEVTRTTAGFEIHDLTSDETVVEPTLPATFGGVQISETGSTQIGDTFLVDPYNGAATGSQVTEDHNDIALSNSATGGTTNTENAANLSSVFEKGVYNGGVEDMHTFIGTSLSRVGEAASSASHRLATSESNHESAHFMRDQIQGVDMNEENISLIQYQSAYQAASKIIQTQTKLMDALLGAV